jgi:hypothetical protein
MSQAQKLTKRQKNSGKRKLLIPSKETQEKMRPITSKNRRCSSPVPFPQETVSSPKPPKQLKAKVRLMSFEFAQFGRIEIES